MAGIVAESGVEIISSTIVNNSFMDVSEHPAPSTAGLSGDVTLINTIISNNAGVPDCSGNLSPSSTNNLIADGSCGVNSVTGDFQFGPLADNGGPTQTHALLPGSAAIDAGDDNYCSSPEVNGVDQRGVARPQDGNGDGVSACDIGAFELSDTVPVCDITHSLPKNKWQQISLPCDPGANNSVAAVFADDISGTYGRDWILYRYDSGGYVLLSETDTLTQGVGYWIIQASDSEVTLDMPDNSTPTPVTGLTGCLGTAQGCFEIPLTTQTNATQWNMIGYPFASSGSLGNARVLTNTGACATGCELDVAQSSGITTNKLWNYDGINLAMVTASDNLDPWKGYWAATLSQADGASPSLVIPKP